MKNQDFAKQIRGALKACIDAHGAITTEHLESATKRVRTQIRSVVLDEIKRLERDRTAGRIGTQKVLLEKAKNFIKENIECFGDDGTGGHCGLLCERCAMLQKLEYDG
jgi:inorganic triphosphatase YgiF